jgi:hypothetical protein
MTPRHAEVFIDGYYAGLVDDFDGIFQSLKLESGPYGVEIVAPASSRWPSTSGSARAEDQLLR